MPSPSSSRAAAPAPPTSPSTGWATRLGAARPRRPSRSRATPPPSSPDAIDELQAGAVQGRAGAHRGRQQRPGRPTRCRPPSWAARSGDPVLFSRPRRGARGDAGGAAAPPRMPRLRARPRVRDLARGPGRQIERDLPRHPAGRRRGSGRQRDRLRPLHGLRPSAGTSTTRGTGWSWPTRQARSTRPPPRRSRPAASGARSWSPRRRTRFPPDLRASSWTIKPGLRGRSHPRRVQPRLADRRRLGRSGRACRPRSTSWPSSPQIGAGRRPARARPSGLGAGHRGARRPEDEPTPSAGHGQGRKP